MYWLPLSIYLSLSLAIIELKNLRPTRHKIGHFGDVLPSQPAVGWEETEETRMWANAQRDGRPAKHRWRPLFNAAKFG